MLDSAKQIKKCIYCRHINIYKCADLTAHVYISRRGGLMYD